MCSHSLSVTKLISFKKVYLFERKRLWEWREREKERASHLLFFSPKTFNSQDLSRLKQAVSKSCQGCYVDIKELST